jgi:hypothetical protein
LNRDSCLFRQHTLAEYESVLTVTMHELRTRVCLCSRPRSTHVMPRDPVIPATGSLGTAFWMIALTRDVRILVLCSQQVTPLGLFGAPSSMNLTTGRLLESSSFALSCWRYTPTDKWDIVSKSSANLTHIPSSTEYENGHAITRTKQEVACLA